MKQPLSLLLHGCLTRENIYRRTKPWKACSSKGGLNIFPLRIQTLKKDFRITIGALECCII